MAKCVGKLEKAEVPSLAMSSAGRSNSYITMARSSDEDDDALIKNRFACNVSVCTDSVQLHVSALYQGNKSPFPAAAATPMDIKQLENGNKTKEDLPKHFDADTLHHTIGCTPHECHGVMMVDQGFGSVGNSYAQPVETKLEEAVPKEVSDSCPMTKSVSNSVPLKVDMVHDSPFLPMAKPDATKANLKDATDTATNENGDTTPPLVPQSNDDSSDSDSELSYTGCFSDSDGDSDSIKTIKARLKTEVRKRSKKYCCRMRKRATRQQNANIASIIAQANLLAPPYTRPGENPSYYKPYHEDQEKITSRHFDREIAWSEATSRVVAMTSGLETLNLPSARTEIVFKPIQPVAQPTKESWSMNFCPKYMKEYVYQDEPSSFQRNVAAIRKKKRILEERFFVQAQRQGKYLSTEYKRDKCNKESPLALNDVKEGFQPFQSQGVSENLHNEMSSGSLTAHSTSCSFEIKQEEYPNNIPFESMYRPDEMRCLALVAHNHMKPAMKDFVLSHKEVLKKFRLTGTNTTMTMLRSIFGDDPSVVYGPTYQSGPLGGDAELCALMCVEDLGGIIFFQDPLSAHPHQADIDCLVRLTNVHNIITAPNPTSAHSLTFVLKCALQDKRKDKIPSFFHTLESPGVKVYKGEQQKQITNNV